MTQTSSLGDVIVAPNNDSNKKDIDRDVKSC